MIVEAHAIRWLLCFAGLLSAQAMASGGATPVLPAELPHERLAWQAREGAKAEVAQAGGGLLRTLRFSKAFSPAWSAHLAVEDWTGQGTLLLEFAPGDSTRLVVGLKDIYGTTAACPVDVPAAGGAVKLPLADLYLQGLMMRYVKSVAFWTAEEKPRTVCLKGLSLSPDGFRDDWPRASMILLDADLPAGRMLFGSNKRHVTVSDEHVTSGKKSFLCQTPKGKWLNTFGLVQHDWRNFKSLAFDLYWPAENEGTMRFILRDAWVKGTGNNVEMSADVNVKNGANSIAIPFSAFKPQARFDAQTPTSAPTAPLNWEFVHQVGWQPQGDAATNVLYLDNIRLEGYGKLSEALAGARKNMPDWGIRPAACRRHPRLVRHHRDSGA